MNPNQPLYRTMQCAQDIGRSALGIGIIIVSLSGCLRSTYEDKLATYAKDKAPRMVEMVQRCVENYSVSGKSLSPQAKARANELRDYLKTTEGLNDATDLELHCSNEASQDIAYEFNRSQQSNSWNHITRMGVDRAMRYSPPRIQRPPVKR